MQVALTMTMSTNTTSTRQRLVQAALELFLSQGISATTTRQISNLAEVNEVTLFRHFGNKYGLLLAVIEEAPTFRNLGEALIRQVNPVVDIHQALKIYASECLHMLEKAPDFVRSIIGEAEQYPIENRQALGRRLAEANYYVAQYFHAVMQQGSLAAQFPPEKLASFFSGVLIGYVVIESASQDHRLWASRDDFLETLVSLLLHGALEPVAAESRLKDVSSQPDQRPREAGYAVVDLPAPWVHQILQRARSLGSQDYALAYVLFGAGLSPSEIVNLRRSNQISDKSQHILQILSPQGARQVPVNQWILGKRYGSYTSNPLTKWLKSRKDDELALFINDKNAPLTPMDLQGHWQLWLGDLTGLAIDPPQPDCAKQTWCVEMIMRGMSLENMSILTGWDIEQLQPYAHRAREKAALEEATMLDRKPRSGD
jgi:AcrR family transcriptional regulator